MAADRLQPPWRSAGAGMSWHHMIPHATLLACWSAIERKLGSDLKEAHIAAFQYLTLCNRELPAVQGILRRLRTGNTEKDPKLTGHRIASHATVAPLEIHERYEIERAVSWPPWNAVEGPRDRSDDPGDQLEVFRHGVTDRDGARMPAIENFARAMERFLQAGPGVASLDVFNWDIRIARDTLQFEQPIEFKADMWVKGDDGKWKRQT
jgi:hypothetical protein